jgi:hypothetical protein
MGNVINLRIVRKRAARRRQAAEASESRALHGQTKTQRLQIEAQEAKAKRDLDAHRIQEGEEQ